MLKNLHVSDRDIEKQASLIFSPVKYGESGVGVCYLGCRIDYSIEAFLQRKEILKKVVGKQYRGMNFILVNLNNNSNLTTLEAVVRNKMQQMKIKVTAKDDLAMMAEKSLKQGKELYLFVVDAHQLSIDSLEELVKGLKEVILRLKRFGAMLFFEKNINRIEIKSILDEYYDFLQNIAIFPVYSKQESRFFLEFLAKDWGMKIDQTEIKKIVNLVGGHLWLLKETLRIKRRDNGLNLRTLMDEPGMKMRLDYIYDLLSQREKQSLAELCFGDLDKVNKLDKEYFMQIGLARRLGGRYFLSLPLLESRVREGLVTKALKVEAGEIYYQGNKIFSWFSPNEKAVLLLLIRKKGTVVEKEEIAESMWGKKWVEKYSDWAIDKLMSRLRKTLERNGLPRNLIKTKKGLGFIIN